MEGRQKRTESKRDERERKGDNYTPGLAEIEMPYLEDEKGVFRMECSWKSEVAQKSPRE